MRARKSKTSGYTNCRASTCISAVKGNLRRCCSSNTLKEVSQKNLTCKKQYVVEVRYVREKLARRAADKHLTRQ